MGTVTYGISFGANYFVLNLNPYEYIYISAYKMFVPRFFVDIIEINV